MDENNNRNIIHTALNLFINLFSQKDETIIRENGEIVVVKKPIRMVFLSVCVLFTATIILLLILCYKLGMELIKSVDSLELVLNTIIDCDKEDLGDLNVANNCNNSKSQ